MLDADALARGAPVYLPVNPIEYHGPHLSLRNDHLVSIGLARDLHEGLAALHDGAPLLVAPELDVGVEPAPGPGSIPVSMREVARRTVKACHALADRGAKRVAIMTFHGSPLHAVALEAGVRTLRKRGVKAFSPLNLILRELLSLDGSRFAAAFEHVADAQLRAEMIRTLPQDFHGGFFETSVAMHYAPESVLPIHRDLPPCAPFRQPRAAVLASRAARALGASTLAQELSLVGDGLAWYALRPFPGYTGRPDLASAEAGAIFAREIVSAYVAAAKDVLWGDAASPPPIMRWLPFASLGGRLGPHVDLASVAKFESKEEQREGSTTVEEVGSP
jgi:creatinine amidohydrolase